MEHNNTITNWKRFFLGLFIGLSPSTAIVVCVVAMVTCFGALAWISTEAIKSMNISEAIIVAYDIDDTPVIDWRWTFIDLDRTVQTPIPSPTSIPVSEPTNTQPRSNNYQPVIFNQTLSNEICSVFIWTHVDIDWYDPESLRILDRVKQIGGQVNMFHKRISHFKRWEYKLDPGSYDIQIRSCNGGLVLHFFDVKIDNNSLKPITITEEMWRDDDKDGIPNNDELSLFNTDPWYKRDTDGDGLTDSQEIVQVFDDWGGFTNPGNRPDTDGDGFSDCIEMEWNTDPLERWSKPPSTAPKKC